MKTIWIQTLPSAERILHILLIGLITSVLVGCFVEVISGQCVDHPDNKTALVFNNESSYDLTFYVDDDEKATVRSRTMSGELEVEPGDHFLRARAIVRGRAFWVAVVNEVTKGKVCTWTVDDPDGQPSAVPDKFRSALDLRSKGKIAPRKRQRQ